MAESESGCIFFPVSHVWIIVYLWVIFLVWYIPTNAAYISNRYTINPDTLSMYVRARISIPKGEEISVQYLSALYGNFKRRKKIREQW